MTENVFQIKRGDTSPAIEYVLLPESVVLTGASVQFQMRVRKGATVVDAPAEIATAVGTPTVRYWWEPEDTAQAGRFEAEFRVTYNDGKVETFPNIGFIPVVIGEDVPDIEVAP